MDFILSEHAAIEMARRQIPLAWVETTMRAPGQIVEGSLKRKVYQSRFESDGKAYLVRLVVEDWQQPPVVVTAYRTSKIEKYWRAS